MKFNTAAIHGTNFRDEKTGATNVPIYQSSSFAHDAKELEALFQGKQEGHIYSRNSNPTLTELEKRVSQLEGGFAAVATSSGMSAIAMTFLTLLEAGDEALAPYGIFGGTYDLCKMLGRYGIKVNYVASDEPEALLNALTDKTKFIFVEALGNPKLQVYDIAKVGEIAKNAGIPLVVDNTITTPYLINPIELGANIVIHSSTKYINGHGTAIGGLIVDGANFNYSDLAGFQQYEEFGNFAFLVKLRKEMYRNFGVCQAPLNAFLTGVGLETLGLRMRVHCSNAKYLAEFLACHQQVTRVNYPGLSNHPQHQLASLQFKNSYGGVLTFNVGSKEQAFQMIDKLNLGTNLANVGDVRTLVIHPASTIFAKHSVEERGLVGVAEDTIRVCVGIEDQEDILADFDQAFKSLEVI